MRMTLKRWVKNWKELFGASDDYDYDSDISYETEPVEEVTEP